MRQATHGYVTDAGSSSVLYNDIKTKMELLLRLMKGRGEQTPVLFPTENPFVIGEKLPPVTSEKLLPDVGGVTTHWNAYVTILLQRQPLAAATCSSYFLSPGVLVSDADMFISTR
jgi:hypothetical protein